MRPQQTLEPVHVRADQRPTMPAANQPVGSAPTDSGKATPAAQPTVSKAQKPSVKKSPKDSSSSVTAAIVATVIIVFGLAALAVLAYLKTKK